MSHSYEADPLECPKCRGPMRVIALIDNPAVVRRILEHLGRWVPEPPREARPCRLPSGQPTPSFPSPITPFRTSHRTTRGARLAPLPPQSASSCVAQPDLGKFPSVAHCEAHEQRGNMLPARLRVRPTTSRRTGRAKRAD
jgi:hypothetical protein